VLDLHGHPEFNVFAAWEPPRPFTNRYQWRQSELYRQIVRDPQNRLLTALPPQTQLRYAEVRALVGGVTAIQGASGRVRSSAESLVRNVDLNVFGAHRARSAIDLPAGGSRDLPRFQKVIQQIAAGEVTPSTCTWPRAAATTRAPWASSTSWSRWVGSPPRRSSSTAPR